MARLYFKDLSGNVSELQITSSNCLPLTGGTMTGVITRTGTLAQSGDTSQTISIQSGTSASGGGGIWLYGVDHANNGTVRLQSYNGSDYRRLDVMSNGTKLWTNCHIYEEIANPYIYLKETDIEKGTPQTSGTSYSGIYHLDKNENPLNAVLFHYTQSKVNFISFRVHKANASTDTESSNVNVVANADGTYNVNPSENNVWDLGTSNYKWANVWATTLNGNLVGNVTGTATNVTGTVAIANGGTGQTTRLSALKALTNESVGTSANYFLTITTSWGKGGYTSVADAKTVLGLGSAAYTASTAYASASHTHNYLPLTGGTLTGPLTINTGTAVALDSWQSLLSVGYKNAAGSVNMATSVIDVIGTDSADGYNTPISIGSYNGTTHIGAGESRRGFLGNLNLYSNENLYLTADGSVNIYTNCANDISTYAGPLTFTGTASASGGAINVTGVGNITVGRGIIQTNTMTGSTTPGLSISGSSTNYAINIVNTSVTKGTAPSANSYWGINCYGKDYDNYNKRVAMFEGGLTTGNLSTGAIRAYNCTTNTSTSHCSLECHVGADGVAYVNAVCSKWTGAGIKDITALNNLGWSAASTGAILPTLNTLAYWNGRYNSSASNLQYCKLGEIVGTTGNQNIGGTKTFTADIIISASTPSIYYKATNYTYTANAAVSSTETVGGLTFRDSNNINIVGIYGDVNTSENTWMCFCGRPVYTKTTGFTDYGELFRMGISSTASDTFSIFRPEITAVARLGTSSIRWGNEYFATAANVSSDERIKSLISDIPDDVLDIWDNINWKQFKFKDSVTVKGENARLHTGLIAQDIQRAFSDNNIKAEDYGLFCHDVWDDEYNSKEVTDENGNTTYEQVKTVEAGDLYSIRYEEALCMEAAYQRRLNKKLLDKIAELEARLQALENK